MKNAIAILAILAASTAYAEEITRTTTTTTTWNTERTYWQENYPTRTYYTTTRNYTTYEPAYKYGVTLYDQYGNRAYTELDQEQLRRGWEQARGTSTLTWEEAQYATRDAYGRLYDTRTVTRTESSPAR